MTEEQNIIYTKGMLLQAEIKMQGMIAENKIREQSGRSLAYGEDSFNALIEEYGVHHNALIINLVRVV
jgi:hypothetical protein